MPRSPKPEDQTLDEVIDELDDDSLPAFAEVQVGGPGPGEIVGVLKGLLAVDATREGQTQVAGERVDVYEGAISS